MITILAMGLFNSIMCSTLRGPLGHPDLLGKDNCTRTVTVPAGVKAKIDLWTSAVEITAGPIFRRVTKAGVIKDSVILDEKLVWRLVARYARETELGKLAPHDLRRTRAKLCRKAGGGSGADSVAARTCLGADHRAVSGDRAAVGLGRE